MERLRASVGYKYLRGTLSLARRLAAHLVVHWRLQREMIVDLGWRGQSPKGSLLSVWSHSQKLSTSMPLLRQNSRARSRRLAS